ncbi:MAG: hypothetical protein KAX78_11335 [Phycisphaerae bacterium]|nr:hypothetical protein [Phycisphaerae bacterium]
MRPPRRQEALRLFPAVISYSPPKWLTVVTPGKVTAPAALTEHDPYRMGPTKPTIGKTKRAPH